jgi:formylglycine-generating enzyme required for sulfatase activity
MKFSKQSVIDFIVFMRTARLRYSILWLFRFILLLGMLCVTGCGGFFRGKPKDEPQDIILKLDDYISMRFVPGWSSNYYIGRYEVRNKEYHKFDPEHSSGTHKEHNLNRPDQPVVYVSWTDANNFCKWLTENYRIQDDKKFTFSLPNEYEWEFLAGCDSNRRFPWGKNWPPPRNYNYYGAENRVPGPKLSANDAYRVSCPVYESGMNEWRIFGMGGNVWEWCSNSEKLKPGNRILKGASWIDYHPNFLEIRAKKTYSPDYTAKNIGFRVVAYVQQAAAEEKEQFAKYKQKQKDLRRAEIERKRIHTKHQKEAQKQKAKQLKQQKQADLRAEINELIDIRDYQQALQKLQEYGKDFAEDNFYRKRFDLVKATKVIKLSEDVWIEFIKIPDADFMVSKYELTNEQYREFDSRHNSGEIKSYSLNQDSQPVVKVSWNDADAFCEWLNKEYADKLSSNMVFRLPAENEWEMFAACNTKREFPWGNQWPPLYGNYGAMPDYNDGFKVTCSVEQSGCNEWNLYGVGGNVWEWCAGWYGSQRKHRVIRGGAWNLTRPEALKVYNRSAELPDKKNPYIGFRVIISNILK